MILAMPQFTDGLAPFALEVNRGSVEKHQIKIGEEIATIIEHPLFDYIFRTAGDKRRPVFLVGELFSQKGHGAIKLMQFQFLNPRNLVIPAPLLTKAVGAGNEKPVQYG